MYDVHVDFKHPPTIHPLVGLRWIKKVESSKFKKFQKEKISYKYLVQPGRGWVTHENAQQNQCNTLKTINFQICVPKSAGISAE
jgi:hypothetical protein